LLVKTHERLEKTGKNVHIRFILYLINIFFDEVDKFPGYQVPTQGICGFCSEHIDKWQNIIPIIWVSFSKAVIADNLIVKFPDLGSFVGTAIAALIDLGRPLLGDIREEFRIDDLFVPVLIKADNKSLLNGYCI